MDLIEDIFSNDVYYPFLQYCQEHNYHIMQDLRRCSFENLEKSPSISKGLLMRIKSIYLSYCKKHPDMHMGKAPAPRPRRAPAADPELEGKLEEYFKANPEALVHVTDMCKALGVKRTDAVKALENASWCKAVDSATFFYVPEEE